jgi:hypothetical protein
MWVHGSTHLTSPQRTREVQTVERQSEKVSRSHREKWAMEKKDRDARTGHPKVKVLPALSALPGPGAVVREKGSWASVH